jgi:protein-disulfide isomerase
MAARQNVRESSPGYLFVLSTLALSVILYLAYASFFVIKAVCLLCLVTYAAVIGLFIISGAAVSFPMTTLPRRMTRDLRVFIGSPLAVTLAVLLVAGAGMALVFFPREGVAAAAVDSGAIPVATQDQRSEFDRWYAAQPRVPLIIPSGGAKVLVVKFNDFQCPACGQSYLQYKPIFAKYEAEHPGEVKLVLKDFPLNSDCNASVTRTLHPAACDAAVAVRLAAGHNRADVLEDWLYTHQSDMTGPSVRTWTNEKGGVPDSEFSAKYAATLALVKGDIALGNQLRVQSTPTFFINGVKVEGGLPPQYFDQAIAYELQRATQK